MMNARKFFSSEAVIRTISLLIALILWMYVVGVENPQIDNTIRNVPVEIINTSNLENNGLEIISLSDEKVDVRIFGRMSDVSNVTPSDVTVQIDVSNIYSANNYYVKPNVKINVGGVSVLGLSRESINVYVDYISRVEKDIIAETIGEPKKGYSVKSVESTTKKVIVTGPQSIINRVDSVKTTVDVSGASAEINKVAEIKLYASTGEEIVSDKVKLSVTDVSLNVKFEYTKEVDIVLSLEGEESIIGDIYNTSLSESKITVTGNEDVLKNISEVKAVLSNIPLNDETILLSGEWEAVLEIPENITVKDDISKITVKFEKK